MAANQDVVDTYNALLDAIDSRTLTWLNDKIIDKKKRVEIISAHFAPFATEAFTWQKTKAEISSIDYETNTILPLTATKLQLESKLIKCQGDTCCYELEHLLPEQVNKVLAEISQIECATSKCTYEVEHLLPSQKSKIECETSLCGIQGSELQLNGTSNRALNTIKGELYTRQKEGFTDKQQQEMLSKLIDIWTITVSQEISSEDAQMNLTKRDYSSGEISEVECAINSVAQTIDALTCVNGASGVLAITSYPQEAGTLKLLKMEFTEGTGLILHGRGVVGYKARFFFMVDDEQDVTLANISNSGGGFKIVVDGVLGSKIKKYDLYTVKEYDDSGTYTGNQINGVIG